MITLTFTNRRDGTRGAELMWHTISDAGPILLGHWFNVSCLLGREIRNTLFSITTRHTVTKAELFYSD